MRLAAALLLMSCAAAPFVHAPLGAPAGRPAHMAPEHEEPPPTRDELLTTCDNIEANTPECDGPRDRQCDEALVLIARVVVRCRELADEMP